MSLTLEHNPLVDSELSDDVGQQQVAMVACSRVHTVLNQQTRPCKHHEASQFVACWSKTHQRVFQTEHMQLQ
jgi:hypothetical protein